MTLRRLLLGIPLALLLVAAATWFWLLHTQSGARWVWAQVEAATGNALSAEDISGAISSGLSARGVRYSSDGVEVSIATASLSANIDLLPLRVTVLPAQVKDLWIYVYDAEEPDQPSDLKETFANLQLPVEVEFTDVVVDNGEFEGIGDDLIIAVDTLQLTGIWNDAWTVEHFSLSSEDGTASGNGSFELHSDNDLYLDVDLNLSDTVTGLDHALAIEATLQGPLDDLTGQGRVDDPRAFWHSRVIGLTSDPHWELRLEMPGFRLPGDLDALAIPALAVTVDARGDKRSFAADADIGFADTDMRVALAVEVDLDAETVSSNIEWEGAHWPIGHDQPQVSSQTGALAVAGNLDDWTVAGTIDLAVPELPPGTLTIDGGGNQDGADVRILEGNVLGGTVSGRTRYEFSDRGAFSATLSLDGVRTATAFPEWPAILSGDVELAGQRNPFGLTAALSGINGEFYAQRLEANGGIDVREGMFSVTDLRVVHGDAYATVDGELFGPGGLRFDAVLSQVGQYIDEAYGSLKAAGVVSLKPTGQFLRVDASSEELSIQGVTIENLSIVDNGSGTDVFNASISADNVAVGEFSLGRLQVRSDLGREVQELTIDVESAAGRTGLSFVGELDDWDSPSSWTGEMRRFEIETENLYAALDEATGIRVAADGAGIDLFCLTGTQGAQTCNEASWDPDEGAVVRSELASVPLDAVNVFIDTRLDFEQVASGNFRWRTQPDGTSSGRGDISMTAGRIVSSDDTELFLETGAAKLGFDIDGDSLRGGLLDIPFPGMGQIAAELEVLDVADEDAADLDGLIDIDIDDVGLFVALFPVIDDASGILRADLEIAGTAGDPLVSGHFRLEEGSLSYLPIGLKLDDINLSSELQDDGEIELSGYFRAGEGRAEISTRADHATTAATGLELKLRGSNLTLIDVPDISAIADTDLSVNFDGQTLEMNGSITIPRARIRPSNLTASRVFESEDVVIVAGELPEEPAAAAADTEFDYAGSVEVVLGEDVVVDLDVTEVDVTGSTVFNWVGDLMPNAIGRYDVDGEIVAFGQRLEITEGSVRFEDEPADDPYLRVRAEREIFGNTQVRRAGVLVAGRISRLSIEPYTNPVTTEERALTLLVTGSDFDIDRGVGALDFGTYVAPRVFVSYGIGLFEEENVIRVRYDLRRGFGVTGSSGGRESGVDLSYQFEN